MRRWLSGPELPVTLTPASSGTSWNPFARRSPTCEESERRPFEALHPARQQLERLPAAQPPHPLVGHKRPSPAPVTRRKPPPPPTLPPPPRPDDTVIVEIVKPRGASLGLRFCSETTGGAELRMVDPYGLGWRQGLVWGDRVLSVLVASTGEETPTDSGSDAARALRPASGLIELRVRRRPRTTEDYAAVRIQAQVLGCFTRDTLRLRREAATVISAHWRRWCAIMDLRALRLNREEDCAAEAIQGAWRQHIKQWVRRLALEFIQEHARSFLALLRTGQRKRKRRCIRMPPMLLDVHNEACNYIPILVTT